MHFPVGFAGGMPIHPGNWDQEYRHLETTCHMQAQSFRAEK